MRLVTLDGLQWDLRTAPAQHQEPGESTPQPLILCHVAADAPQAQAIADWLNAQGIAVELLAESTDKPHADPERKPTPMIRLWTRAARDYWTQRTPPESTNLEGGLLLRTEAVDWPTIGNAVPQGLDWQDWARLENSAMAARLLEQLRRWQTGEAIDPPAPDPAPKPLPPDEPTYDEAIAKLLAEIDDPATEPPRRLEIGDRLAELGDPRPGVGVREIEVPIDEAEGVAPEPPAVTTEKATPAAAEVAHATHAGQSYPPRIQRLLDEFNDPNTEPPRRLAIGDELDLLGDPRPGVGIRADGLPDIDWVEIPGGPFVYQHGDRRELPTYWMSRYPITNGQFEAFIDAGGYEAPSGGSLIKKAVGRLLRTRTHPDWWVNLKKPQPEVSRWLQSNRPRTNVDWYEAVAFTRWLAYRLGVEVTAIRLPTELEWEKAARGEHGLTYPWGQDYRPGFANVDETSGKTGPWYLRQTTAVGVYPQGRSPYAVHDLSGTVWEWCLNEYQRPDANELVPSDAPRALRGGSWDHYSDHARADDRNGLHPDYRGNSGGFRVVSSVPM